jgi:hypothetical protein
MASNSLYISLLSTKEEQCRPQHQRQQWWWQQQLQLARHHQPAERL